MATSLAEAMARATDDTLFEILHLNRSEYSAEAVAAAEEELRHRDLSPARLQELQASVDEKKQSNAEPLHPVIKVGLFASGLLCVGILLVPLAVVTEIVYREADAKRREAWQWLAYGLLGAFVIMVAQIAAVFFIDLFGARP